MPKITYPNIGISGGWMRGESGWGDPMNDNMLISDTLIYSIVKSKIKDYPTDPSLGDLYLVDSTDVSSNLSNKTNHLLLFKNLNYIEFVPKNGWKIFISDEDSYYEYRNNEWKKIIDLKLSSDINENSESIAASTSLTNKLNKKINDQKIYIDTELNDQKIYIDTELDILKKSLDCWDLYPPYSPLPMYNVTFGGSDGRRAIMPGESVAREDWILCDGGSNGKGGMVPDLRGRMILGASYAYPACSIGGSEAHTHSMSGTVDATTLSVAQMPSHNHTFDKGTYGNLAEARGSANDGKQWTDATGGSQPHTHTISNVITTNVSNLPPYYVLTYIIKIK